MINNNKSFYRPLKHAITDAMKDTPVILINGPRHAGKHWISGIILYQGDKCLPFGNNLWAIPFACLD